MARSFSLPDLGEGIHEGEVLAVFVSVGDKVKEGDPILEVETDKAAVEIPSPFTGTVEEIRVQAGDVVRVGDVLMTFSNGKEIPEKKPEEKAAEPAAEAVSQPQPSRKKGPVPASPATRRLARELGVDLKQVVPGGPGGLVTAEDVRALAANKAEPAPSPEVPTPTPEVPRPGIVTAPSLSEFTKWGPVERVPLRSVRKATAKRMTLAWSQIPHVNSQDVADITKLEAFRRKHKDEIKAGGGKLTLTVFALKAAVTALKAYPYFNATLDNEAEEIILKRYYNIGVAVDTEDGLIVPVVRDIDRKSITELAIELNDLVQRTRLRKTTLEELQGGTFTITNVGRQGGGNFTPIINYPEVAIMGTGAARMQPVVKKRAGDEYEIVPRLMMPLVLCFDHRVLDGADAMRFMRVVVDLLEDPDRLLMTMA